MIVIKSIQRNILPLPTTPKIKIKHTKRETTKTATPHARPVITIFRNIKNNPSTNATQTGVSAPHGVVNVIP